MNETYPDERSHDGLQATADYLAALRQDNQSSKALETWGLKRRGVTPDRFYKRLAGERDALLACLRDKRPVPVVHLLVLEDDPVARQACADAWRLQSHPHAPCEAVNRKSAQQLREWLVSVPPHDLVVQAAGSDRFHPALATALALRDSSQPQMPQQLAAWSWNEVGRSDGKSVFVRKPGCSPMTLLGGDYVGRAIAVRAAVLRTAPENILTSFFEGAPAPLVIWLAGQKSMTWLHHPEILSARASTQTEMVHAWQAGAVPIKALQALTSDITGSIWQAPAQKDSSGQGGPLLQPPLGDGQAQVSVIVPFRNYVPETLKAVAALARQTGVDAIEVLLINNGSSEQSLASLKKGLQEFTDSLQIRIIDYPWGFSHSRQCNLGVQQASFETIVILNNDAYLQSPEVLSDLIRWAGIPGIGTVGVQIVDESNQLVCAGLRARLRIGFDFESGFEESRDPLLSNALREVAGNTGACFAMRADRYRDLGGFDEQLFPIGLNDVDFCLRARRAGLTHINLGWLQVCHKPGTSRGATDELMQKVVLRERYPEMATLGQFQLGVDDHLSDSPGLTAKAAVHAAGGGGGGRPLWWRLLSKMKRMLKDG